MRKKDLSALMVSDAQSADGFVRWCVEFIGLGYHPDTPFSQYVDEAGRPLFTEAEAQELDILQEASFQFSDPYEIGISLFQEILSHEPDSGRDEPTPFV